MVIKDEGEIRTGVNVNERVVDTSEKMLEEKNEKKKGGRTR